MTLLLITGGARSGKSRYAEARAAAWGPYTTIVTAEDRGDPEMAARIAAHRARRAGPTVEAPLALPEALAATEGPVLLDCLTLWLSNLMLAERDPAGATPALIAALTARAGPTAVVSNEVGWGIVPDNPLGRAFRDAAGTLNQAVAAAAAEVVLVAAGLPLQLKGQACC